MSGGQSLILTTLNCQWKGSRRKRAFSVNMSGPPGLLQLDTRPIVTQRFCAIFYWGTKSEKFNSEMTFTALSPLSCDSSGCMMCMNWTLPGPRNGNKRLDKHELILCSRKFAKHDPSPRDANLGPQTQICNWVRSGIWRVELSCSGQAQLFSGRNAFGLGSVKYEILFSLKYFSYLPSTTNFSALWFNIRTHLTNE